MGALEYGLHPDRVISRKIKKTIGIVIWLYFKKSELASFSLSGTGPPHTGEPLVEHNKAHKKTYYQTFVPIAFAEQDVRHGQSYECEELIHPLATQDHGVYVYVMSTEEKIDRNTPLVYMDGALCDRPLLYGGDFEKGKPKRLTVRIQFQLADVLVWAGAVGSKEEQRVYPVNM